MGLIKITNLGYNEYYGDLGLGLGLVVWSVVVTPPLFKTSPIYCDLFISSAMQKGQDSKKESVLKLASVSSDEVQLWIAKVCVSRSKSKSKSKSSAPPRPVGAF